MAPIAELANKAFSAFEKYQQLQTSKDDLLNLGRSNEVKKPSVKKTKSPSSLAGVLMKLMKFKEGIEKKNGL